MSSSGSREGFGSPPWDPADPVPELADTQALPGLGPPGARQQNGQGPGQDGGPGQSADGPAGTSQADDRTTAEDAEDGGESQDGEPVRKRPRRRRSLLRELPVLVVVALVLALIIKTYAIQAFYIPSSSMENTLDIGDRVLINKLVYDFRPIHRGDIVVFNGDGSWDPTPAQTAPPLTRLWDSISGLFGTAPGVHDFIKRVIGVPGDHVACCNARGQVTVNGVPLKEKPYLYPGNAPSATRFSITVPPGRLWVMGDHRAVSWDSRGHMSYPGDGTIPENHVVGRAFVIVAPISRWRILPIPATFEQPALNDSHAAAPPAGGGDLLSARAEPTGQAVPLVLGFAGAIPLTWLQRRVRLRVGRRRRLR